MPPVQRKGDPNSAGGIATGGVGSVRANNRPVVVNGTNVTPHPPYGYYVYTYDEEGNITSSRYISTVHERPSRTTSGVGSVRAGGIPINVNGNPDTCGHPRTSGSSNVRAGG